MRFAVLALVGACGGLAAVDGTSPPRSGVVETVCPEEAVSGTVAVPYGAVIQLFRCSDGYCEADYFAMTEAWEVVIPCRRDGDLYVLTWIQADALAVP